MTYPINRRRFLQTGAVATAGLAGHWNAPAEAAEGEQLYNGIRLPSPWPPKGGNLPKDNLPVPAYLASPPSVIPIDVGRQLFVDDFLIAQTTLKRTHHLPTYYAKNPVLTGGMPFSDGVFYDPQDKIFKIWYLQKGSTAYATSKDGLTWEKPALDVKKGTNIVLAAGRDSSTTWIDLEEKDSKKRYKMFRSASNPAEKSWCYWVHFSADGIHWSEPEKTGACGDRSTVFYNPFRKVWVYSLRHGWGSRERGGTGK